MKACIDFKLDISRRLDGELDAGSSARLETHLAECPGCRAFAAELENLKGLFTEATPKGTASPGFRTRVLDALRRERRRTFLAYPLWSAAAAVLVAALTVGLSFIGDDEQARAEDLGREVHYEDLFLRADSMGAGDLLHALLRTDRPATALRVLKLEGDVTHGNFREENP